MSATADSKADGDACRLDVTFITGVCADVFAEGNFSTIEGAFSFRAAFVEEPHWELFRGHALDKTKTRERRKFLSWALFDRNDDEPVLAVRWDTAAGRIHVTRSILSRTVEANETVGGVVDLRDVVRRIRELVGTVDLETAVTAGDLRRRLAELVLLGVVGLSRLPLTSVDAPLPEFTLGRLGYDSRSTSGSHGELERAKRLEFAIRSTRPDRVAHAASGIAWDEFAVDFRAMFDAVSLSPWTDFVPNALSWLRHADGPGGTRRFGLLARLLVQIARHLNAYDLVTFHHFGANFPDALVVDAFFQEILTAPAEARDASWRAGVRAAALVAAEYSNHLVPDAPTSQGESSRVLPTGFPPVPEEQIATPHLRNRRLFADRAALMTPIVRNCVGDLDQPAALVELGTALFIDRPLGVGKLPGEPDHTWLSSHILFSRTLAEKRLRRLAQRSDLLPDVDAVGRWRAILDGLHVVGVPLERRDAPTRPGVASLQDAFMVADDFVFLRTTRRAVRDFAAQYDCTPLANVFAPGEWHVVAPTVTDDRCVLTLFDRSYRLRVELDADLSRGFARVGGTEYVAVGFRVDGDTGQVLQAQSS